MPYPSRASAVLTTTAILLAVCGAALITVKKPAPPASAPLPKTAALPPLEFAWPPVPGEAYPDLKLLDDEGRQVSLSKFKGKVILLEPTAMTCAACQAFSGGNRPDIGGFGLKPQADLIDLEESLARYADGVSLDGRNVVFVQLLIYNLNNTAPSVEEVQQWRDHFQLRRRHPNMVFLVADPRMLGQASYDMIPGFHLIDRDFRFTKDSSGHTKRDDLWSGLFPELGRLGRNRGT